MHQPSEPRRYQLFPAMDKLAVTLGRRSPDPESALSVVTDKERLQMAGTALRKPKEQTLVRRRKVSVPELGPMTTVQEVAMDSRMVFCCKENLHISLTDITNSNDSWSTTTARTFHQRPWEHLASAYVWREHVELYIRAGIGRTG